MLHLVLYGLLAVIVAAGLFLVATRFLPAGEQIAPPLRDEAPWDLPAERNLQAADVDAVRLPVALRGYRFAETDILLDRLATELRTRDEEIARLKGRTAVSVGDPDDERDDAAAPEIAAAADGSPAQERYTPPPATAPPSPYARADSTYASPYAPRSRPSSSRADAAGEDETVGTTDEDGEHGAGRP